MLPLPGAPDPILARLTSLGFRGWRDQKAVACIIPPLCPVPGGEFLMGSDRTTDPLADDDECSPTPTLVASFAMAAYPVTVAEYVLAVQAGALPAPHDWGEPQFSWQDQQQRLDHPVIYISWENARDYCHWLAAMTGQAWRLPSEAEWEKAARWDTAVHPPHARIYPWGDQWDHQRANTIDGGPGMTTPVGFYNDQGDASPYGCHDMAGNVWEWTSTIWEGPQVWEAWRVVRGGAFHNPPRHARTASRTRDDETLFYGLIGFRLALSKE